MHTLTNRKQDRGFTLAELLVVVAIIGVLVAVSIPIFTGQLDKAKAATDKANVRSAKAAAVAEYLTSMPSADTTYYYDAANGTITTDSETAKKITGYGKSTQTIKDKYNGNGDMGEGIPFDGTTHHIVSITISSDGNTITANWESGTASGSGTSSGNVYPGTNASIVASYWPTQDQWDDNIYKSITVNAGSIFKYSDGNYYVVVKDTVLTKAQAATGPNGAGNGWFSVEKMTGRVITGWNDGKQKSDLNRGDIAIGTDGNSYVYIDGGSWAFDPIKSPGQWYKLP